MLWTCGLSTTGIDWARYPLTQPLRTFHPCLHAPLSLSSRSRGPRSPTLLLCETPPLCMILNIYATSRLQEIQYIKHMYIKHKILHFLLKTLGEKTISTGCFLLSDTDLWVVSGVQPWPVDDLESGVIQRAGHVNGTHQRVIRLYNLLYSPPTPILFIH